MIRLENLSKTYAAGTGAEVPALKNISLRIERGEFVAVQGQSGSGKSTLLNIVGLLDAPDSGRYYLLGEDTASLNEGRLAHLRNQQIGFVVQDFALIRSETAQFNVELPLLLAGAAAKKRARRALALLEALGIADQAHKKVREMSGGQRQRVAIARAMANNPAILLADEPTGALDHRTSREVMDILLRLNAEQNMTILLVTHERELAALAARRLEMADGRLTEAEI